MGVFAQWVAQYSENKCSGADSSLLRNIRGVCPSTSNLLKPLSDQAELLEYTGETQLVAALLSAPNLSVTKCEFQSKFALS
jgi:hypothetical protein